MKKYNVYFVLIGIFVSSCDKDFQNFNLPKNNRFDVRNFNRQSIVLNCENLNQVNFFDGGSPSGSDWSVAQGVVGNGFRYYTFYPSTCGFDFNIQCDSLSSISFWTDKDASPELYIDGLIYELVESKKGDSVTSSVDFKMHESAAIDPGSHQVRVQFDTPSVPLKVDQIIQWVK